jgi:RNA polymerase sigma factor (sigma-70 family)
VHGKRLYRLLVRLTLREDVAEDLLQDLFVKLSRAAGFAEADDPYAYARRAATNLAFSWIRSARAKREQSIEDVEPPVDSPPAWSRLVAVEDVRWMLAQMANLNDGERLILTMRYFDDARYSEIAGAIGATEQQARARGQKALRKLRIMMVEQERKVFAAATKVST